MISKSNTSKLCYIEHSRLAFSLSSAEFSATCRAQLSWKLSNMKMISLLCWTLLSLGVLNFDTINVEMGYYVKIC